MSGDRDAKPAKLVNVRGCGDCPFADHWDPSCAVFCLLVKRQWDDCGDAAISRPEWCPLASVDVTVRLVMR